MIRSWLLALARNPAGPVAAWLLALARWLFGKPRPGDDGSPQ